MLTCFCNLTLIIVSHYSGFQNNLFFSQSEMYTRLISTGTSINGPIIAANASLELKPNIPIVTAIASSKLLLAAVKERVAVSG